MKNFPSCREVRERLTDYAEGSLSFRERAALRFHLLICTACNAFFQGLRRLPGVARHLLAPEQPPPAEAGEALAGALRRLGGPGHSHRD
jgi:anti-sigma factor ChrR (cupin superfamily)